MFLEIFLFELRLAFRKPSTYIYFAILFAFTMLTGLAVSGMFDTVRSDSNTIINSASSIAEVYLGLTGGILLLFWSSIIISVMGTSIQRDYQYNTHPLFFTKPITKKDYFFGRLLGSLTICILIFAGLMIGYFVGTLFGMGKPMMGPYSLMNYLQPFLIFILPNLLFFGLIFFSVTTFARNTMAAYIAVILFFVFQIISGIISQDIENKFIASLLEPTGSMAFSLITEYWSPAEKNLNMIPITGALLYNRLLWLGITFVIGFFSYVGFTFSQFLRPFSLFNRKKKESQKFIPLSHTLADLPSVKQYFGRRNNLKQIFSLGYIEWRKIIRSVFFIVISLLSIGIIITAGYFSSAMDKMSTYLVTYKIVDLAFGSIGFFLIIFIIFFSGNIIWREKEAGMDELVGVTPPGNAVFFFSKFVGLFLSVALLYLAAAITAIIMQVVSGFYQIDILQYLVAILSGLAVIVVVIALALSVQCYASNKYLGFFFTLVPLLIIPILFGYLEWSNSLNDFNSESLSKPYSDMNGYGGRYIQWPFYRVYWYSISAFLCLIALIVYPRGKEKSFKSRWKLSRYFNNKQFRFYIVIPVFIALVAGFFIYYQEYILVDDTKPKVREKGMADYEKKYKHFEKLPQPRIVAVNLNFDIFTKSKELNAAGSYILKNKTEFPIDTIYFDYPGGKKNPYHFNTFSLLVPSSVVIDDPSNGIRIFSLAKSLQPGDSLSFVFNMHYAPKSFYYAASSIVQGDGTFLNNDILPSIGYSEQGELGENTARKEYGLPFKSRIAKVDDKKALMNNYISSDADWIRFEATLSTDEGQIAIAPGYLTKQWVKDNRSYFQYKMDSPILNFYSLMSATYLVKHDKWQDVNLEIYYHKGHEFNLDRMMRSIKLSLDYYTKNFGPYQHKQLRIIEFPRYASFAQSFPNTIPYSEAIGFILKVEDDPEKIDIPFYVTAHEVAHQWWAHQVIGGNVQGSVLMSESMSQYCALMVMEKEYGKEAMKKFLKYEMDQYLQGRTFESKGELPLMLCENQQYIHYNKGSVVMYALKDFIGEEKLNGALKAYLEKVKFSGPPYTNSIEFINFIKQATPDSLQYLVTDLFEKITIYENYVSSLDYIRLPDSTYKVTLKVGSAKYYSDSLGNRSKASVNDYMDIGIFAAAIVKGKEKERELLIQRIKMDQPEKTFEFIVKEKPVSAGIDPYLKLIDRKPENNSCKFGKKPVIPNLNPNQEGVTMDFSF